MSRKAAFFGWGGLLAEERAFVPARHYGKSS